MNRNIYLTGFMGSGKTTVGRILAESLNRPFVDLDQAVEARLGKPVQRIFDSRGEDFFRSREREALLETASQSGLVVATGGGLPVPLENRELMRRAGLIIHLKAGLETCCQRIGEQGMATRPLWQDPRTAAGLFARRAPAYADNDLELEAGAAPERLGREIMARLAGEREFTADLGGTGCPVRATFNAPLALAEPATGRKILILTDSRVARLHLDRYLETIPGSEVMVLSGGERIKSLTTLKRIYEKLLELRFNRDDLLLALGGGTVTDLGAFAAATYKRGLGLALASTTLLGCVDAAVGGKAAVNLGSSKNIIGCFTTPEKVVLDLAALGTLKIPQVRDGLVEACKTGLVASPELAGLIEEETGSLLGGDPLGLARVVGLSARAKADVVARDFRESGMRMILNLGHTLGHAVEAWHNHRISHGLAVGVGLMAALRLSKRRGLLSPPHEARMSRTVAALCGPFPALPSPGEAWEIMAQDKKITGGRLKFVLIRGPGQPVIVDDLDLPELAEVMRDMRRDR